MPNSLTKRNKWWYITTYSAGLVTERFKSAVELFLSNACDLATTL